jgi:hypothetical protein
MSATPEINRANAQHSTGPTTEVGKQRSSLNALRHGLTSRIAVMPTEDIEAYETHKKSFTDEYSPQGATEAQSSPSLGGHFLAPKPHRRYRSECPEVRYHVRHA